MGERSSSSVKLIGAWFSPFSFRVRCALDLKKIKYDYIEEDMFKKVRDTILRHNPSYNSENKKVPVFVHGDKRILDSLVIIEYIEEQWSGDRGPSRENDEQRGPSRRGERRRPSWEDDDCDGPSWRDERRRSGRGDRRSPSWRDDCDGPSWEDDCDGPSSGPSSGPDDDDCGGPSSGDECSPSPPRGGCGRSPPRGEWNRPPPKGGEYYLLLPKDLYQKSIARYWIRFIDDKSVSFQKFFKESGEEQKNAAEEIMETLIIIEQQSPIKDNDFFGGDKINAVDLAFAIISPWFEAMQKVVGVPLFEADNFPKIHAWTVRFKNDPVVRKNLPDFNRLVNFFEDAKRNGYLTPLE